VIARAQAIHAAQPHLLRDIVGIPFRAVSLPSSVLAWNDHTMVKLAGTIYEGRAFDRLPVLGDALEDAGCTSAKILSHCRRKKMGHARGCWVADALLGKS